MLGVRCDTASVNRVWRCSEPDTNAIVVHDLSLCDWLCTTIFASPRLVAHPDSIPNPPDELVVAEPLCARVLGLHGAREHEPTARCSPHLACTGAMFTRFLVIIINSFNVGVGKPSRQSQNRARVLYMFVADGSAVRVRCRKCRTRTRSVGVRWAGVIRGDRTDVGAAVMLNVGSDGVTFDVDMCSEHNKQSKNALIS